MKDLIKSLEIFESYGFTTDDITLIGDKLCVNRSKMEVEISDVIALEDHGFEYDYVSERFEYDFGRM